MVTALSFSVITHETGYVITSVVGLYYFIKDHIRFSDVVNVAVDNKAV
jgi:hypothetical protein